ncbi:hypothetical protein HYQ45_018832 [Verticillium longisporum]|uniref:Ketoreductase domain-containing protein n=1 Tax=Verticillium longisporum TaxID=100787 RepID=A0A8I2ZXU8_VERLO|nr:hypothetical protein HYQ45_018832 [Verticillium longisporum]
MSRLSFQDDLLQSLNGRSVIVTGAARGIGAATATLFNEHGALVCITDLPARKEDAQALIDSMKHPENAIFAPASVTDWTALMHVFKTALSRFGVIHMVVANAGIMESSPVLDVSVDDTGDPIESKEANRVLDVNLKGTLNRSVVLVASISGYFGSTGNAAYIASKHGVIGLLRASLDKAASLGVRVNAVTPGYTPTGITKEFGNVVTQAGLDANTPGAVATAIAFAAADPSRHGTSCLVLTLGYSIMGTVAAIHGYGRDDLTAPEDVEATYYRMIAQSFSLLATGTSKASVGFFLLRLVVVRWQIISIWAIMSVMGILSIRD